jgi:hypothetical protein
LFSWIHLQIIGARNGRLVKRWLDRLTILNDSTVEEFINQGNDQFEDIIGHRARPVAIFVEIRAAGATSGRDITGENERERNSKMGGVALNQKRRLKKPSF